MHHRSSVIGRLLLFALCIAPIFGELVHAEESARQTPLVRAVSQCRQSVVNLRGRKTVPATDPDAKGELKQVNGMGTGVVIDPRGYILTNYHVIEGVSQIEVSTCDRDQYIARLVAHDPTTDLAVLKIDPQKPLPPIHIGTSSDLMLAETVAAVGNAYGYEHTVTVGIISQLGRTVQVNDSQVYRNLIQTDAPINPGNSGGPLLNLDGEMIGINVAVRIGAQGIAFAIPVNDAMEVAARLMDQVVTREFQHGLRTRTIYDSDGPRVVIEAVQPESPAERLGLARGDVIRSINERPVNRAIDIQCALLDLRPQQAVSLDVMHGDDSRQVTLVVQATSDAATSTAWSLLGLQLEQASDSEMQGRHPNYKRGLKVVRVRPGSPAETEGILEGDVLVAMHGWKTETPENLEFILTQPDFRKQSEFMFYILRDSEPFWGKMRLNRAASGRSSGLLRQR